MNFFPRIEQGFLLLINPSFRSAHKALHRFFCVVSPSPNKIMLLTIPKVKVADNPMDRNLLHFEIEYLQDHSYMTIRPQECSNQRSSRSLFHKNKNYSSKQAKFCIKRKYRTCELTGEREAHCCQNTKFCLYYDHQHTKK